MGPLGPLFSVGVHGAVPLSCVRGGVDILVCFATKGVLAEASRIFRDVSFVVGEGVLAAFVLGFSAAAVGNVVFDRPGSAVQGVRCV